MNNDYVINNILRSIDSREEYIKEVIIHCSDSTWGDVDAIRSWHLARGFDDIGYHIVIENGYKTSSNIYDETRDGIIEIGRPIHIDGAHTIGHNKNTLAICLIGRTRTKQDAPYNQPYIWERHPRSGGFSKNQILSLENLCLEISRYYPYMQFSGHNEYSYKLCPCFNVKNWFNSLKDE